MDARELLRRYLEQRRDLGERDLVFDSLNVEEALTLLGAPLGLSARRAGSSSPTTRAPTDPHLWGQATPSEPDHGAPQGNDWRSAMRAAGEAPEATKEAKTAEATKAPIVPPSAPIPNDKHADSPLDDIPIGLVVGGAARLRSEDPLFTLGTLEEIAATVASCTRCPLYATAINPVPGSGSPTADLMIVGEAPGANEDAQGVPFVGQAGQLLTKIIAAIDMTRDDVFIANVLKHRPPGNRNPSPEEVSACSPYLVRQIELVRPKVLLALGTFAAQTLLETKLTIGKLRGQIHRYYGVPLIVTYHPAALLRNPAWKRPTWEDVQLARRILDRAQPRGT